MIPTELEWRRAVMGETKDALAAGDCEAAYQTLTKHEQEGYPWAPGAPSNRGPAAAHEWLWTTAGGPEPEA